MSDGEKKLPQEVAPTRTGLRVKEDGSVIYEIGGHVVEREDFLAITLFYIQLSLEYLATGEIKLTSDTEKSTEH
jgi:hypothetical protein